MLAKVPEGIKVEPGEVTVDLANLGDESACAQQKRELMYISSVMILFRKKGRNTSLSLKQVKSLSIVNMTGKYFPVNIR